MSLVRSQAAPLMPYTREQITPHLQPSDPNNPWLLVRGKQYLGRDVPEGYFVVQDWCLAQGATPLDSVIPDLMETLQGVEYLFQTATGNYPDEKVLVESEIIGMMHYLNRETEFEGGALRQYPELQKLLKEHLLQMPKGAQTIAAIQKIPQYADLFVE